MKEVSNHFESVALKYKIIKGRKRITYQAKVLSLYKSLSSQNNSNKRRKMRNEHSQHSTDFEKMFEENKILKKMVPNRACK